MTLWTNVPTSSHIWREAIEQKIIECRFRVLELVFEAPYVSYPTQLKCLGPPLAC